VLVAKKKEQQLELISGIRNIRVLQQAMADNESTTLKQRELLAQAGSRMEQANIKIAHSEIGRQYRRRTKKAGSQQA